MVLGALCQEPRTKIKYISYYTTKFAPLDPLYALLWARLCLETLMSLDCIVQTPLPPGFCWVWPMGRNNKRLEKGGDSGRGEGVYSFTPTPFLPDSYVTLKSPQEHGGHHLYYALLKAGRHF